MSTKRLLVASSLAVLVAAGVAVALSVGGSKSKPGSTASSTTTSANDPEGPTGASASKRPNIVLITSDDQTSEEMQSMKLTQRLIGRRGTTFNRQYNNWPLCCPSRATHLTGQYAHNHDVLGNYPPKGGYQALDSSNTLPVWLDNAGYYTSLVGKYLNGYGQKDRKDVPAGWDDFHSPLPGAQRIFDYNLNENGEITHFGSTPNDYKDRVITRKALHAVESGSKSGDPFFLWVTYGAPHSSGNSKPRLSGRQCTGSSVPIPKDQKAFAKTRLPKLPNFNEKDVSDKPKTVRDLPRLNRRKVAKIANDYRCRRSALRHVDRGVASIIARLRSRHELRNTVIMYDSDNGFSQGEHRYPTGKNRPYEEVSKVPLLISGPGFPRGKKVNTLTSNADLAPTIVRLAKAKPLLVMDGRPLMPIARNPGKAANRTLLMETRYYHGVETQRFRYTEYDKTGEFELYDLKKDPYELANKAGKKAYAKVQQRLAAKLAELRACAGADCRD